MECVNTSMGFVYIFCKYSVVLSDLGLILWFRGFYNNSSICFSNA